MLKLKEMHGVGVKLTTQQEADDLMKVYESAGWVWRAGQKPTKYVFWDKYKVNTYVDATNFFVFGNTDIGSETIISMSEFFERQGITPAEVREIINTPTKGAKIMQTVLTMEDIEVGKKYRVKPEYVDECSNCSGKGFDYIVVVGKDSSLRYQAHKNGACVKTCSVCYKPHMLETLEPTKFEDLRAGHVVLDDDDIECQVLFGNGLVVIVKDCDNDAMTLCKDEFEEDGYTIAAPKQTTTELSMDEIAAKFGLPVSSLKIKKQ
jgi:hypothetical protein